MEAQGIRYALIGGFAMALRGVQRATMDMDFILMMEDLDRADRIISEAGFQRAFCSENASSYVSEDPALGRLDILHAFRGPTLSMLERADRIAVSGTLDLPVVQLEDIVGLKVQASVNDPARATSDWADIRLLIEDRAQRGAPVDWDLIADYLEIFGLQSELNDMRAWYGSVDPS